MIKFICYLEKKIEKYKQKYAKKINRRFLRKYQLMDLDMNKKTMVQYNPYQPTGIFLIDSLIEKEYILKDDHVLDVGSGTGLFVLYLASKGFNNLTGVEIDEKCYEVSIDNLKRFPKKTNQNISFECFDVVKRDLTDVINVFFLFNTFYDKDTYLSFFNLIKESLKRKPRKIKVIILFPTISSISALRETEWLYQQGRVFNSYQMCSRCNYFLIYGNKYED